MRIPFSVGVVGLSDHLSAIEQIRDRLPLEVYVRVNAYKRVVEYYSDEELRRIRTIDPYFDLNRQAYDSFGKPCRAGQNSFTVDEHGDARRCHFVDEPIGNIYGDDIFAKLAHARTVAVAATSATSTGLNSSSIHCTAKIF